MAEYSKQYCDIWDPRMHWDFDIEVLAKDLVNGNYYPIICEGFGFLAIAKDDEGKTLLAIPENEEDVSEVECAWVLHPAYAWVYYEDYIAKQLEDLKKTQDLLPKVKI
jgi:hypothetical protein